MIMRHVLSVDCSSRFSYLELHIQKGKKKESSTFHDVNLHECFVQVTQNLACLIDVPNRSMENLSCFFWSWLFWW